MGRFYCSIKDVPDDDLAFLGYTLIRELGEFRLYQDYTGEEYIVDKANPFLSVEDVNDAIYLNARRAYNKDN